MKISEAFSLIAEIAIATGNAPITKFDDCWEIRIDDRWSFAVNGHAHERPCSFGAINGESDRRREQGQEFPRVLYDAKKISDEVPRMILLFELERTTGLPQSFKMCGHDPRPAKQLKDNHLRCALGKECRKCEYLDAIDRSKEMTPEAKDEAKAWTCATHFLLESKPGVYFETILREKSDDEFDARMAASFCD